MTDATIRLYAHPLSSYCWKALIALYEKEVPFELAELGQDFPGHEAEFRQLWPLGHMPLLLVDGQPVAESSIIVERVDGIGTAGPRLVPEGEAGLTVRFLDRIFDNDVMAPMQRCVADRLRPEDARDARMVAEAKAQLDRSYAWLEQSLGHGWAAGGDFTLADIAAAPALFYADEVHPFAHRFLKLGAYLKRLLARPSVARAVAEAQPYRSMFPFADG